MTTSSDFAKMLEWVKTTNADIVAAELIIHTRYIKDLQKRVRRLERANRKT